MIFTSPPLLTSPFFLKKIHIPSKILAKISPPLKILGKYFDSSHAVLHPLVAH